MHTVVAVDGLGMGISGHAEGLRLKRVEMGRGAWRRSKMIEIVRGTTPATLQDTKPKGWPLDVDATS